jgi:hypothetical protein
MHTHLRLPQYHIPSIPLEYRTSDSTTALGAFGTLLKVSTGTPIQATTRYNTNNQTLATERAILAHQFALHNITLTWATMPDDDPTPGSVAGALEKRDFDYTCYYTDGNAPVEADCWSVTAS